MAARRTAHPRSWLRRAALAVALGVLIAACGTERPQLEEAGGGGVGSSEAPELLVVGREVTEDDGAAPARRAATGRAARAIATPSAAAPSDPDPDPEPDDPGTERPPLVVLDTDMGPDIDDALALAMLHTYQDREQAEIAAVTVSRNSVLGARFVDAVNTWHGHPDIPVGIDRRAPHTMVETSSYVSLADRWPNDVATTPVPDGVTVLRQVLARALAEDRRVVIVQVGFSGNVAALLDSPPDPLSVLDGTELVAATGAVLSIMAGSFEDRVEFNVANDVASARRVVDGWPGELILSPFELGYDVHYPYAAVRDRLGADNPTRQAYEFTDYSWHVDAPPYYDMRSWDLTSVMVGIEPSAQWFPLSDGGTVTMDADGRTSFGPGSGLHRILVRSSLTGSGLDRAVEAMVELVSLSAPQG